ncbi:uncharacterized protein LOC129792214 isoform X2 [Lutzomyia longipalpis]|uniref:Putative conserved secreted protein n=1 Tax=Lutzomyia longipalpis TaxID=7200 RepID=A0A1B0CI44_LUTLO|nr:uncharacterized protein LOC129792214 isoform X2 [Lutzomyia longipalpis]
MFPCENVRSCVEMIRMTFLAVFLLTVVAKFVEADRPLVYSIRGAVAPISPDNNVDSNNYNNFHINYDEYPMIVPKRAAMLLDRIMVALHHALENESEGVPSNELEKEKVSKISPHRKIVQQYILQQQKQRRPPKEAASGEDSQLLDNLKDYDADLNDSEDLMDLERRGHRVAMGPSKGRQYWRCYFNAVTCF